MMTIAIIFFLFAFIHSVTLTLWFKGICQKLAGDVFMRVWYRFLYNQVSIITAAAAFYFIKNLPDRIIWVSPLWLKLILHGIQLFGLVFGALAFRYLDMKSF